jgi:hypothetical protein
MNNAITNAAFSSTNAPPDQDKTGNWLPAPADIFSLYIRCYWPEESILNGSWEPPAVLTVG